MDNKSFTAFNMTAEILTPEDSEELYTVLAEEFVLTNCEPTQRRRLKRILKSYIKYTFDENNDRNIAVGVRKDGKLVAGALLNDKDDVPWIGCLNVSKKYRRTRVIVVLMHFILNILYKDKIVKLDSDSTKDYGKRVVYMGREINMSAFTKQACKDFEKAALRSK